MRSVKHVSYFLSYLLEANENQTCHFNKRRRWTRWIVYLMRSNEVLYFSNVPHMRTRTQNCFGKCHQQVCFAPFSSTYNSNYVNKMSKRFSKSAGYWESIIEPWTVKKITFSLKHFSDYFLCCKCLANLPVQMCWYRKSQTFDLTLSKFVELCAEPSKTFWAVVHGIWNVGR